MESTKINISPEAANPSSTEMEKVKRMAKRKFKIYPTGIMWGLMGGLMMGAYLLFLNLFGGGERIALNFLKYFLLAGILAWELSKYRNYNLQSSFFQKAMWLGILTSAVSAITLLIVSLLVSVIHSEWTFNHYFLTINSLGDSLATSGTLLFEVTVLGSIITFICVQYLKGRDKKTVSSNS